MLRKIYMDNLFSNRRESIVDYCCNIQKQGKNFIYILPSREAMKEVRYSILKKNGGMINSHVIMIDELEDMIVKEKINKLNIIDEDFQNIILSDICENIKGELNYYKKIYNKKGFIKECRDFIKNLKRQCIDEEKLENLIEKVNDNILKEKLKDLRIIYKNYIDRLNENNIYDINDISLKAVEYAKDTNILKEIDAIIIDGFINIDYVNIKLIEKISENTNIDIIINSSFKNYITKGFLDKQIVEPFSKMNFELEESNHDDYEVKEDIKSLCENFYSGEKVNLNVKNLKLNRYPCIEAEVREIARDIKRKLISGEDIEKISVFINNIEEYSKYVISIFEEFNIPCELSNSLCLSDLGFIRNLINKLEEEENTCSRWIEIIEENIEIIKEEINIICEKALTEELSVEEKIILKAHDHIIGLINKLKANFKASDMLSLKMSRENFIEYFKGCISISNLNVKKGLSGSVKIISTDLARGVMYDYVYILGVNEGEIPKNISSNLFNDKEIKSLKEVGFRYRDYLWELTREKIRFNLAMASAKKEIHLSYRSSTEDESFAICSSFIDEIKFLTNMKKEHHEITMRNRFEIKYEDIMSSFEIKLMVLKNLFEIKYNALESLTVEEKIKFIKDYEENIDTYIQKGNIAFHKEKEIDFNEYEGIINTNYVIEKKEDYYFTPSSLAMYFKCPYAYMIQRNFKVDDIEEDEEVYNNIEIGNLYHNVLYKYYLKAKESENLLNDLDEDIFNEIFDKEYKNLRELNIEDNIKENIKNQFKQTLNNFINFDIKRLKKYEKETKKKLKPFILEERLLSNNAFSFNIACKIDRVDLEYELIDNEYVPTGKFIIYDYKKKNISNIDKFINKEDCQLAMYYYLVKEKLQKEIKDKEINCMGLLYLSIEDQNKTSLKKDGIYRSEPKKALDFTAHSKFDMDNEKFEAFLDYLKEVIENEVKDIKKGKFNYTTNCFTYSKKSDFANYECSFKDICRYSKDKMNLINAALEVK